MSFSPHEPPHPGPLKPLDPPSPPHKDPQRPKEDGRVHARLEREAHAAFSAIPSRTEVKAEEEVRGEEVAGFKEGGGDEG